MILGAKNLLDLKYLGPTKTVICVRGLGFGVCVVVAYFPLGSKDRKN